MSRERRNQIILVVLLVIFAGIVVNQFVLSDDDSSGSPTTRSALTPAQARTPNGLANRPSPRQRKQSSQTDLEQGYRPLPLQALRGRSGVGKGSERNVFVYYVPPPPPPKVGPPPPPPPITIHSVNPLSVFARTKDFTLRVFGVDLPEDAQIFVNGRPLNTTRVSATELTAEVEKRLIASPGQLQVEVKNSAGNLYSNQLSVTVQEPPEPIYKYIGRIDNLVFLQKESDERLLARLGQTVENRWRVAQITSDNVVLEDVVLDIPYTIAMENPTAGVVGGQPGMADFSNPAQRIRSGRVQRINPQGVVQPQPEPNPSEEEEP